MPTKYKYRKKKTGDVLTKPEKKQVRKIVKQEIKEKAELKYNDVNTFSGLAGAAVTDTPGIAGLINITQGTTDSNRIGDEIYLKDLTILLSLWQPLGSATNRDSNFVRFTVFQWDSAATAPGSTPVAANLYQYPTSNPALSPFKHDTQGLYTILFDRMYSTTSTGSNASQVHKIVIKKMKRKVLFDGAASTFPITNSIFFSIVSNTATASADYEDPKYSLQTRIRYYDM